jgi:hypothetical protein
MGAMAMGETMAALEQPGRLVIDAWAGNVSVSAGRGGAVEVAVRCWGVLPAPALEIERDGDDVYVESRSLPLLQWLPDWVWNRAQIEVSVPARYSVDVATSGGRVEIRGFDGEVAVRSV